MREMGASWIKSLRPKIRFLRKSGWTDADVRFAVRCLRTKCPGEVVELVYKGAEQSRRALCKLEDAPPGWFERTRLRDVEGDLGFLAATTLSYWSRLDIEVILATESD